MLAYQRLLGHRSTQRSFTYVAVATFLCLLFYYYYQPLPLPYSLQYSFIQHDISRVPYQLDAHIKFWEQLHTSILNCSLTGDSPIKIGEFVTAAFENLGTNAADIRPDVLRMKDIDLTEATSQHQRFVAQVRDSNYGMVFKPKSRGIATTAGGNLLPIMVMSLRMVRQTGCTLPFEVFMADETEYEKELCEQVLPSLNARCIVLSHIFDSLAPGLPDPGLKHYQFKIFAILLSSFEDVLFLDADSFPVQDPEKIFLTAPFTSHGLITFPDFWASSISPLYYQIASRDPTPLTAHQSTESGQIFVSKRTHRNTLMLAAYYNFYGPQLYYPLFSQGAHGEGDKETFLAAAETMNETYYQTSEWVKPLGRIRTDGSGFKGSAMVQSSPSEDYTLTSRGIWRIRDMKGADLLAPPPAPLFVHANYPKFNPATLFGSAPTGYVFNPTLDETGHDTRAWMEPRPLLDAFEFDVEKVFWEEIEWVSCRMAGYFKAWKDEDGICENVRKFRMKVFPGTEEAKLEK